MFCSQIYPSDFEAMFRLGKDGLAESLRRQLQETDTGYRWAEPDDLEEYSNIFEQRIAASSNQRSQSETLAAFEKGWGENLRAIKDHGISTNSLKPGYFRGNKFLRYGKGLIVTANLQLEFELFDIARRLLFAKYLSGQTCIWELGAGNCQNIFTLAQMFPEASLHACDWTRSSLQIASYLAAKLGRDISASLLDLRQCRKAPAIPENSALISIHAFEQLGSEFEQALDYVRLSRPAIVLQYEPVLEFYDTDNPLDELALRYCRSRGYLEGYYSRLLELENEGALKILAAFRPGLGGVLHESSLLVWQPVKGDVA